MMPCDKEMYKSLGEDIISEDKINMRICPDLETIKEVLRVKNSYTDKNERVSFSIQAVACDPE